MFNICMFFTRIYIQAANVSYVSIDKGKYITVKIKKVNTSLVVNSMYIKLLLCFLFYYG